MKLEILVLPFIIALIIFAVLFCPLKADECWFEVYSNDRVIDKEYFNCGRKSYAYGNFYYKNTKIKVYFKNNRVIDRILNKE